MDEISVYKAKEEVRSSLIAHIDHRFETEKNLIQSYILLGLKISIASLGLMIIVFGFFGWKSYSDINNSIKSEIKTRFTDDNPVKIYEKLLKNAATSGIIASIQLKIRMKDSTFDNNEEDISFLVAVLRDNDLDIERKVEILELSPQLSQSNILRIARVARKYIQYDFKDDREQEIRAINSLLAMYRKASASEFKSDIIAICDKYKTDKAIIRSISTIMTEMTENDGAELRDKIIFSMDPFVKYNLDIFKYNNQFSPEDLNQIDDLIRRSYSKVGLTEGKDYVGIRDIFMTLDNPNMNLDILWKICNFIAKHGRQEGFLLTYSFDKIGFGDSIPRLYLRNTNFAIELDLNSYRSFLKKLGTIIISKTNNFSSANQEDISTMEFFMMKTVTGSSRLEMDKQGLETRVFFVYDSNKDIFDETGLVLANERHAGRLAIRLQVDAGPAKFLVIWRDTPSELQTKSVLTINSIDANRINIQEIGLPSFTDGL